MQTIPREAVAELEASFKSIATELKREAPEQHARFTLLLKELRAGKGVSDSAKQAILDLTRWQLQLQRQDLVAQVAAFESLGPKRPQAALESEKALKAVIRLLDQSLAAVSDKAPSPQATAAIERSAKEAEAAVDRASELLQRSTLVPLKPVLKQPVSSTGIKLKPVEPPKKKAKEEPLQAFKLRPGALPPTPGKKKK